jgi:hypothetical protein
LVSSIACLLRSISPLPELLVVLRGGAVLDYLFLRFLAGGVDKSDGGMSSSINRLPFFDQMSRAALRIRMRAWSM